MKTVCIYHSVDLDGWMSAAIVKYWFVINKTYVKDNSNSISNTISLESRNTIFEEIPNGDSLTFIGYNYGQPIPDLSEYDKVIMCDISFPKEEMEKLFNRLDVNLIWIDHHISAFKEIICEEFLKDKIDLSTKYNGLRDLRFAACELTWKYFFPNEEMPEIVRLLGMYDSFRHKGTDEETKVLEFQYGARQRLTCYEDCYEELGNANEFYTIRQKGKAIYEYLCTEAKQVYSTGFEVCFSLGDFKGNYKFICINRERFNPINFGINYHKDGYDGCACFWYTDGMWNFSLYNDNGLVDCSVIAKQYGGGGHAGASGFRIKDLTQIIK